MARLMSLAIGLALVCSAGWAQAAEGNGAERPAIVETSPVALANDVDPALDKITVTFDRPMTDNSWSWTGGGETYPETADKPSYDEAKTTCALPVKLVPGKVYWVGVNSPSHQNFKSADGQPVRRYAIVFATKSADGQPTPIPQEMLTRAKQINGPARLAAAAKADDPKQQPAMKAAETWMQLVDAEQYAEMWETLDPLAKKMVDQKTFTDQIAAVRGAMGKLTQRTFASAEHKTSLPGVPDGNYYLLQYNSSFEKKKQAVETAVMTETEGQWRVSGYFIK